MSCVVVVRLLLCVVVVVGGSWVVAVVESFRPERDGKVR